MTTMMEVFVSLLLRVHVRVRSSPCTSCIRAFLPPCSTSPSLSPMSASMDRCSLVLGSSTFSSSRVFQCSILSSSAAVVHLPRPTCSRLALPSNSSRSFETLYFVSMPPSLVSARAISYLMIFFIVFLYSSGLFLARRQIVGRAALLRKV